MLTAFLLQNGLAHHGKAGCESQYSRVSRRYKFQPGAPYPPRPRPHRPRPANLHDGDEDEDTDGESEMEYVMPSKQPYNKGNRRGGDKNDDGAPGCVDGSAAPNPVPVAN